MDDTLTAPGPGGVGAAHILDALDPEQREVASTLNGPLCVLAGAGTGKTRAITHRIAYGVHCGVYRPQQVLAVTFTARAAGEMRSRLRDLGVPGVQARTFHAAALRQLGYFWPQVFGGRPPEILEYKARLVAEAANRLRLQVDRAAVRDLSAEVEWSKVSLLTAEAYPAAAQRQNRGEPGGLAPEAVARLITVYEEVKADRGVIDFEDVLLLTAGLVEEYPEVATAVRSQYRHFVVDEYQDVSALQHRLLQQWLGDRQELCVVGDPSQTIYSFTGASPQYLLGFTRAYPQAQVVKLVRDYRSTPQVVDLANRLLAPRGGASGARRGGVAPLELIAQREPGPKPKLSVYEDDVAEAGAVARAVLDLVESGVRPREIAVLFRTNAQSESLEQALTEVGMAYVLKGGERFFARKEVRDALMLLRGARAAGDTGEPLGEQVRAVLATSGWSVRPPSASGAVRERWESLQALASLADEIADKRPGAGMTDLVNELDERASAQHAPTVEGVTLASLHAAKGLEWDAVFLVGLSEGLMPITFAEGWEAVEEERRLLYVGITRAREHLRLSWSRARTPGARATRSPSRFLDGLFPEAPREVREGRSRAAGARKSAKPALCRVCGGSLGSAAEKKIGRCSTCPSTYDEALFERLRTWRLATASEASVPAYVVFTDATLVAIAETLPSDSMALARVPGVGPTKLERYGEQVLAVLAES
ncbi:ATP-dependent DNA helicase UvrD2 [Spongisporangium articulatum]|uniref:DNA 3'-5' helicase n=1 Tax=Spongisporangium articulatum TaxID=3362603 RepID=A0ABW8AQY0_9ACTN